MRGMPLRPDSIYSVQYSTCQYSTEQNRKVSTSVDTKQTQRKRFFSAAAGGARRADLRRERAEADGVRLRRTQPAQRTRATARVSNGVRGTPSPTPAPVASCATSTCQSRHSTRERQRQRERERPALSSPVL